MPSPGDQPSLLVITGPTAVGKTDLALSLAEALQGEIISADSRQVYRLMDIGTAKPTPQQQARATHHLIDVVNPDETLTLAQVQALATHAIDATHQRGRLPILVGGTGQYISAVVEGWHIPQVAPDDALRAELEAYAAAHGPQALHSRLAAADPIAARQIHPNNVRRVVRALEVYTLTGQPISVLQRRQPPPYRIRQVGLTLPRAQLYAQADARVHQMMRDGFLDEVRALRNAGYSRALPSMSGIGYAQLSAHLDGEITREQAIEDTIHATHSFIRRQYTWLQNQSAAKMTWHAPPVSPADTARLVADVELWAYAG